MIEKEKQLKDEDLQVEILKKDLDGVRFSNEALLDRNHELKEELVSLQKHAELLDV